MQRGAGLRVQATAEAAAVGTELVVRIGPVPAPCRVVYVLDEADRRGFAYGTLAGHPESGEELFSVRYDPATDTVPAEVVAFSRPATWWSRLGGAGDAVAPAGGDAPLSHRHLKCPGSVRASSGGRPKQGWCAPDGARLHAMTDVALELAH